jgi:hypothetical protein
MRLRIVAVLAAFCVVSLGLGAAPALASTGSGVTAVTHTSHHPDTTALTSHSTPTCTISSPGGPVWAYDNLSFRFKVMSTGTGMYTVTITASGTFTGFANRFTGACTAQSGSVHGFVNYEVHSTLGPTKMALPSQEPGTVPQTTMLKQLFQGTATVTSSNGYSYTYTLITGMKCVTNTTGFICS